MVVFAPETLNQLYPSAETTGKLGLIPLQPYPAATTTI